MGPGKPPTRMVAVTAFWPGSILETDLSRPLATQIPPSPAATSVGHLPVGMVVTIWLVAGTIRTTECSRGMAAQTAAAAAAIPEGGREVLMVVTILLLPASSRVTPHISASHLVTQIASGVKAILRAIRRGHSTSVCSWLGVGACG